MAFSSDNAENVSYTYDQSGHGYGIGRLTSVADAVGTLSRSYDQFGNLLTDARTSGTVNLTTTYTYDAANRIASITYPSGTVVSYTRDSMGRITAVGAQPSGGTSMPVVSSVTYEPFGPYTAHTYGNGVAQARGFDQDYRLTSITDIGSTTLQSLVYTYYPTNNVETITDAVTSGNSQSFSYDSLQRLSSAAGGYGTFGFTYDPNGNRSSQTHGMETTDYGYGYGTGSDLLATLRVGGVTTQTIGYTADGRMATLSPDFEVPGGATITSLSYNQDARLAAVNASSGALGSYTYDGFGQRIVKTISGTTGSLYQYSQDGMLLEETDASGVAQTDYIDFDGKPIATLDPSTGTLYFLHDDLLGTPQLATDASQSTVWQATYQPFGQASVSGTITQNLRFPGQYFDIESGWNYNAFRDYLPSLGRYVEPDPLGRSGSGNNLYVYVSNSPTNLVDPLGLQTQEPDSETPFSNPKIHHYSCLAWGLGIDDHWIQPSNPIASPNSIMPLFGCNKVPCDNKANCKKRVRVNVYEDSVNPSNWHVKRQTCAGAWTSKNGQSFLYNDIPDPDAFYKQSYNPEGTVNKTCWSCPAKPQQPNDPRIGVAQ